MVNRRERPRLGARRSAGAHRFTASPRTALVAPVREVVEDDGGIDEVEVVGEWDVAAGDLAAGLADPFGQGVGKVVGLRTGGLSSLPGLSNEVPPGPVAGGRREEQAQPYTCGERNGSERKSVGKVRGEHPIKGSGGRRR